MTLQFMWWGSLLQTVAPDCFLKMRQQQAFGTARFYKRLDPDESSTGPNASYADSWLRSDFDDFEALLTWTKKQAGQAVIVIDLWSGALGARSLNEQRSVLDAIIDSSKLVVFLLPRVAYGGWRDFAPYLEGIAKDENSALVRRMECLRENYEFLINYGKPFSILESGFTERDFVQLLDLDFARTRKMAGIVHLVPRDIAVFPLGLEQNESYVEFLVSLIVRSIQGPGRGLCASMPPGQPRHFRGLRPISPENIVGTNSPPLVRRADGVLAVPTSWSMYQRVVVSGQPLGAKKGDKISRDDRHWLLFLSQYEALLSELNARKERVAVSEKSTRSDRGHPVV